MPSMDLGDGEQATRTAAMAAAVLVHNGLIQ
jgi:hypothetical protein